MVVGNLDGIGIIVEHPRAERADDKPLALESLVDGRRHVDGACDRLKIHDIERVRVAIAIPSHDIEHVERIGVERVPEPRADHDFGLFGFVNHL